MMMTYDKPMLVFLDQHSAHMFLAKIKVDDTYNCTYAVKCRPGRTYIIEINDENGECIAYL